MQTKLREFFVLEVTARAAASILRIHLNPAALFYRKIRQVIAFNLAKEAHEIFQGDIETDESYFGGVRKGIRGRGVAQKSSRLWHAKASWQGLCRRCGEYQNKGSSERNSP